MEGGRERDSISSDFAPCSVSSASRIQREPRQHNTLRQYRHILVVPCTTGVPPHLARNIRSVPGSARGGSRG
eukprot:2824362-Rhodomonas_salina.1